jgi:ketosteroid isomerase-like protein
VTDDHGAIDAVRLALQAAENAANADAMAALLSEDAVLMVPDFPVQEGRASCAGFMHNVVAGVHSQLDRHITYVSAEVVVMGDMAFDRGTFSVTVAPRSGGDHTAFTGKYFWLLQRAAPDVWQISRLIVSRDDKLGAEPRFDDEVDSCQESDC